MPEVMSFTNICLIRYVYVIKKKKKKPFYEQFERVPR